MYYPFFGGGLKAPLVHIGLKYHLWDIWTLLVLCVLWKQTNQQFCFHWPASLVGQRKRIATSNPPAWWVRGSRIATSNPPAWWVRGSSDPPLTRLVDWRSIFNMDLKDTKIMDKFDQFDSWLECIINIIVSRSAFNNAPKLMTQTVHSKRSGMALHPTRSNSWSWTFMSGVGPIKTSNGSFFQYMFLHRFVWVFFWQKLDQQQLTTTMGFPIGLSAWMVPIILCAGVLKIRWV